MLDLTVQEKRKLKAVVANTKHAPDKLRGALIAKMPDLYYTSKEVGEQNGVKYSKLLYDALYGRGSCATCGKEPVFISMFQGYKRFCSNYCLGTSPEIQEQKKAKCRATTGFDYPMQSKRVRTKSRKTVQKHYGVDNVSQAKEVQDAKIATFYQRYGYSNSSKHPDMKRLIGRRIGSSLAKKKIVNGQGKQYVLQGYEPQALKYMKRFFKYRDIHGQCSGKVPNFDYYFDGRQRVYFPDFFIDGENCIVEVKSIYTFTRTSSVFRMNKAKAKAVAAAGYEFKLLVMHENGSRIKPPPSWTLMRYSEIKDWVEQQGGPR